MGIRSNFLFIGLVLSFLIFVAVIICHWVLKRNIRKDYIMEYKTKGSDLHPISTKLLWILKIVVVLSAMQAGLLFWAVFYLHKHGEVLIAL